MSRRDWASFLAGCWLALFVAICILIGWRNENGATQAGLCLVVLLVAVSIVLLLHLAGEE